ncbi:TspO/MBR family protein [Ornithinimicrobium sp. LYQ121]|uniref:TspO/MBR family protein n=1 Tax=Ornithinimicrobium sp. LYQ121 TaxID=3378801 RepID=UPI00385557A1
MRHPTTTRYRWHHALAVGVAANLASALPAGYNGDEDYYASLRTPPGAPPGWLFAPVWATNNALTLWSNLRIANLPPRTPGRRTALAAEAASWVLFSAFSGVYFGLRSPVLGALDTAAGLAATAQSVRTTARLDRAATLALVPRLLWLGYATYVSTATAIASPDRLMKPSTPHQG